MASNAKDLLSCPICFEHFQDPRLLHCGHTFCLGCLTDYHDRTNNSNNIICPTCRSDTNLPSGRVISLPKDFRIGQLEDVIKQSEDKKKDPKAYCVLCKERNESNEACRLCIECKRDFCEQCALRHSSVPAFKQHTIISMPTGDLSSSRYCGSHSNELLMYNCSSCDQFVCSLCITDTHVTCDVNSITESLSINHEKLQKALGPLVANEETLNAHLRDYNITIQKLNETQKAIDNQARIVQEQIQRARKALQRTLANYEQEQMAKLLTSLSADGSVDENSYRVLRSDMQNLSLCNDPWTIALRSRELIAKAINVNQSLEKLKQTRSSTELQYVKFCPAQDSLDLGKLVFAIVDPAEKEGFPDGEMSDTEVDSSAGSDRDEDRMDTAKPSPPVEIAQTQSTSAPFNLNNLGSRSTPLTSPTSSSPRHTHRRSSSTKRRHGNKDLRGKKIKRSRSCGTAPNWGEPAIIRPNKPVVHKSNGIKISGLPSDADESDILELFGFDVVLKFVLKDTCAMEWSKTAWILYQFDQAARCAVKQFHQKVVLGKNVQVRLCDGNVIMQEANDTKIPSANLGLTEPSLDTVPSTANYHRNVNGTNTSLQIAPNVFASTSNGTPEAIIGKFYNSSASTSTAQNVSNRTATSTQSAHGAGTSSASFQPSSLYDQPEGFLACGPMKSNENAPNYQYQINPNFKTSTAMATSNNTYSSTNGPNIMGPTTNVPNITGSTTNVPNMIGPYTDGLSNILDNLPEPVENVDFDSDVQNIITNIRNATPPPVYSTTEENVWSCQNCAQFNFGVTEMCSCGVWRPRR